MDYFREKKELIRNALIGVFLIVAVIVIAQRFSMSIEVEKIRVFVNYFGVLAPVVYIMTYTATIVFSPLAGLPFIFAGLILFGLKRMLIYYPIALLLGASINFYIGRKFGRPLIRKIVGKKGIEKIDEFAEITGWQALLIIRLFVSSFFDYISYAIGLTSIKFRTYFLITLFASVPMSLLSLYIFNSALNAYGNVYGFAVFIGIGSVFAIVSMFLFYLIKKNQLQYKVFKNSPDKF